MNRIRQRRLFSSRLWPDAVQAGQLFNFDFTTAGSLSDFTITNPASIWALSGGYLRITNSPGSGGFGNHARYNGYGATQLSRYTLETTFIPRDRVAASFGITLAMKSVNTTSVVDIQCFFEQDSTNPGKLTIYRNAVSQAVSGSNLSWSVGDRIKLTMVQDFLTVTFTATNLTAGGSVSVSKVFSQVVTSATSYTTAKPAFYSNGGLQDVEYLKYSSTEYKNSKLMVLGDSITMGYSCTTEANSWFKLLTAAGRWRYLNLGNPSAKTTEILGLQNELEIFNPQYVLVMMAGNDLAQGVPAATYEPNYLTIINRLKAKGTTVIHSYATPRDATNMTPLNTYIETYTDQTIDNFTPLKDGGTGLAAPYDQDGTHITDAGGIVFANTTRPAMPIGVL